MYLDLHAHANINNIFMFGNTFDFHDQVSACMFPYLMSLNSPLFDYKKCILNDRGSRMQEIRDSENKDGAGRVAMWTKYGILRAYTLEAGYNMCTSLARALYPEASAPAKLDKYWSPLGLELDYEGPLPNNFSAMCKLKLFESQLATYFFTQRDYELVGKEIVTSLLDLVDKNPLSRVLSSPLRNMRALKAYFALKVVGEELPYKNDAAVKLLQATDLSDQAAGVEEVLNKLLQNGKVAAEDIELLKRVAKPEPAATTASGAAGTKKPVAGKPKAGVAKKAPGAAAAKLKPKVEVTFVPRKTELATKHRKMSVPSESGSKATKPSSPGFERGQGYKDPSSSGARVGQSHSLGRISKSMLGKDQLLPWSQQGKSSATSRVNAIPLSRTLTLDDPYKGLAGAGPGVGSGARQPSSTAGFKKIPHS